MRALIVSTGLLCSRLAPYTLAQAEGQRQHHTSARREHSSAARTYRHTARERQRETRTEAQSVRCPRVGQQRLTAQTPRSTRLSQHRLTTHNRTFVHCVNTQSNHRTFVRLLLEQTLQPFKALKSFKKTCKKNKKSFKKDLTNERFYAIIDLSEREREVRKAQPNPSSVCETPRGLKGVLRSESDSLTVRALLQRLF